MTYPQPPYPPQGQPGYNPQGQPGYPPQQPQYQQVPTPPPGYPPQPAYYPPQAPPPGYAPQPQYPPQAPPPGYAPQPQYPPSAPAPVYPTVRATLGEFMDQPTMGGGSATSKFFTRQRPQGSWLRLQVTRDLMASDVNQQKDNNQVPQFFKTGSQPDPAKPKLVLIIPTTLVGSSDQASAQAVFSDGAVALWLKGITRDALVAAIGAAGLPDPGKILAKGKIGGAIITMISAGTKPARTAQYTDTNLFDFHYTPGGHEMDAFREDPTAAAAPASSPQYAPGGHEMDAFREDPTAAAAPASSPQYAPQGYAPAPSAVAPPQPPVPPSAAPAMPSYAPPAPQAPQYAAQVPQVPAPPQAPGQPQMTPEMAATLARLSGQG